MLDVWMALLVILLVICHLLTLMIFVTQAKVILKVITLPAMHFVLEILYRNQMKSLRVLQLFCGIYHVIVVNFC